MKYRPDIDGLRALAVIPVVLFHAGFRGVHGGYVGVDVFFVISGYLITSIVAGHVRRGDFSLADFYHRRVRRIFPALFVMMAVVTVLSVCVMLPGELAKYGRSVVATTLFSSNVAYYFETGYFTGDAHAMPLLHTWSLAVEEQFYLLWPLAVAWLGRQAGPRVRWLCWSVAGVSLLLSVAMVKLDASAGFYLVFTRTWELMLGAMLVLMPPGPVRQPWLRELVPALGIVMILLAVKFFNQGTPFPGFYALLPCLGAAAILHGGGDGPGPAARPTLAARALSMAPVVFIGKVSFSLYLWHWPVMVFAQIWLYQDPGWLASVAQVALSLGLAWLSWRFVEQPLRTGAPQLASGTVLRYAGVVMLAFITMGAVLMARHGLPGRFNAEQLRLASYESYDGDHRYRGGRCFIVDGQGVFDEAMCLRQRLGVAKSVLLVGDSHAAHLWPGLEQVLGAQANVLQANETGCRPVLAAQAAGEPHCQAFFRRLLTEWLPGHPVDTVILAGRWSEVDLPALSATVVQLKHQVKNVLVAGPVPQYASSLPRLLVKSEGDAAVLHQGLVSKPFELDSRMRTLVQSAGGQYFSVIDSLCPGRRCQAYAQAGVPMQFDYGHFTVEGSVVVARKMSHELAALE